MLPGYWYIGGDGKDYGDCRLFEVDIMVPTWSVFCDRGVRICIVIAHAHDCEVQG